MQCKNKLLVVLQKENCNKVHTEIFFSTYVSAKQWNKVFLSCKYLREILSLFTN